MPDELSETPQPATKALLVTEAYYTGATLKLLVESLKKLGIQVDIATIGIVPDQDLANNIQTLLNTRVFYGNYSPPPTYPRKRFGVKKKESEKSTTASPASPYSVPARERIDENTMTAEEIAELIAQQKPINESRHDVALIADELVKWYHDFFQKNN